MVYEVYASYAQTVGSNISNLVSCNEMIEGTIQREQRNDLDRAPDNTK
jgi:hypothetical protein